MSTPGLVVEAYSCNDLHLGARSGLIARRLFAGPSMVARTVPRPLEGAGSPSPRWRKKVGCRDSGCLREDCTERLLDVFEGHFVVLGNRSHRLSGRMRPLAQVPSKLMRRR